MHLSKLNQEFKKPHDINIRKRMNFIQENEMNQEQLLKLKVNAEDLRGKSRLFFRNIELAVKFINVLANYSYSLIFISSYKYLTKYLKDITFENTYLTQYFKHIDSRRCEAAKKFLLPLKKIESTSLTNPFKLILPSTQGHVNVKLKLFWYLIFILGLGVILVFEILVWDFMTILNTLNHESSKYESNMKYEFRVKGSGIMANMIKSILNEVNIDEHKYYEDEPGKCLPKIVPFDFIQIYVFIFKIISLLGIVLIEMYFKRMNRVICAFYYRKVEKKRIIWLYNSLLKKRLRFLEEAKQRIIDRKKNELIYLEFDIMESLFEPLKKWITLRKALNLFGFCNITCIICNEKYQEEKCIKCGKCESFFCSHCYLDIDENCLSCNEHLFENAFKNSLSEELAS
jgi:hypothetical protein